MEMDKTNGGKRAKEKAHIDTETKKKNRKTKQTLKNPKNQNNKIPTTFLIPCTFPFFSV